MKCMKDLEERIRKLAKRAIEEIAREFKKPERYFKVGDIDHPSHDPPVFWKVYVGFNDGFNNKETVFSVKASNSSSDEEILAQLRDGIVSGLEAVIVG